MHINLNDLLARATAKDSGLVKRTIEWKHSDDAGEAVTEVWDIFIVKDISFAASDRIYLGDIKSQDSSKHARLISERVRFGEKGEEAMTSEQASGLDPSLGWALVMAVHDFDKENEPKEAKTSSPETKSGTN